jgi:rubrerythrin
MDVVEYFERMERIFRRGDLRFPGESIYSEFGNSKDKRPQKADRNLGGEPWACRHCGTIYFPEGQAVECPFCFAPQARQSGPLLHKQMLRF